MYCNVYIKEKEIVYTSSDQTEKELVARGFTFLFAASIKNLLIPNSDYKILNGKDWNYYNSLSKGTEKYGRVFVKIGYVVDLNKPDMITHAKDALYEDIQNAVKYDGVYDIIETEEAPEAKETDIANFLQEIEDKEYE